MTLTVRELFRSPLLACAESRCSAPPGDWGVERCDDITTLLLTRTGVYARRARGRETIADAGMALLYRAGEPYRIGHPTARGAGHRCTILRPSEALLDEVFCAGSRVASAARLGAGAQLLHATALALWRAPAARDGLAGEEAALALLDRARRDFGPAGDAAGIRGLTDTRRGFTSGGRGGASGTIRGTPGAASRPLHPVPVGLGMLTVPAT